MDDNWPTVEVLVMEDVRLIGGGGLLAWIEPRRSNVFLIVALEYIATRKIVKFVFFLFKLKKKSMINVQFFLMNEF